MAYKPPQLPAWWRPSGNPFAGLAVGNYPVDVRVFGLSMKGGFIDSKAWASWSHTTTEAELARAFDGAFYPDVDHYWRLITNSNPPKDFFFLGYEVAPVLGLTVNVLEWRLRKCEEMLDKVHLFRPDHATAGEVIKVMEYLKASIPAKATEEPAKAVCTFDETKLAHNDWVEWAKKNDPKELARRAWAATKGSV